MLNAFFPYSSLIKTEYENVPMFSKFFVDYFLAKPNPRLRYECKILPFEESISGVELFKCPLCHTEHIEGRKNLTDHLHQHQLQYRPFEGRHLCCLCGKELSSNSSLERHLLTHSNHRPFDCPNCGKKFTTNGNLSRHFKTSHGSNFVENPVSKDLFCSKSSFENNAQNFLFHNPLLSNLFLPLPPNNQMVHNNNIYSQSNFETNLKSNSFLNDFKDYFKADKGIGNPPNNLKDILNLSTKSAPEIGIIKEENSFKSNGLGNGMNKKDSLLCRIIAKNICRKYRKQRSRRDFSNFFLLKRFPMKSRQRIIEIFQDTCEKPLDLSIRKLSSRNLHENSFLSNSSPNLLSPSPFSYFPEIEAQSKLKLRKNSYNDAPKLIRCPMNGCARKFPWNSSLSRHILTHIAHKPFQCIRCCKTFSTKSNRERHMERVHEIKVIRRSKLKYKKSLDKNIFPFFPKYNTDKFSMISSSPKFLSSQELIQMSCSDRKAEMISHSLLKQAGDLVIEPNPHRQPYQLKTLNNLMDYNFHR